MPEWAGVALGVLAVIVALLWFSGSLDRPLSEIGLNRTTCAENFFGKTMCGDELVAFCKESYDAESNGDVCEDVLREEDIDPAAIEEEQEQAERRYDDCVDASIDGNGDISDCDMP